MFQDLEGLGVVPGVSRGLQGFPGRSRRPGSHVDGGKWTKVKLKTFYPIQLCPGVTPKRFSENFLRPDPPPGPSGRLLEPPWRALEGAWAGLLRGLQGFQELPGLSKGSKHLQKRPGTPFQSPPKRFQEPCRISEHCGPPWKSVEGLGKLLKTPPKPLNCGETLPIQDMATWVPGPPKNTAKASRNFWKPLEPSQIAPKFAWTLLETPGALCGSS